MTEDHINPKSVRWWGYRHASGSCHVKLFFDWSILPKPGYPDFCTHVVKPFFARTREEALDIVRKKTMVKRKLNKNEKRYNIYGRGR